MKTIKATATLHTLLRANHACFVVRYRHDGVIRNRYITDEGEARTFANDKWGRGCDVILLKVADNGRMMLIKAVLQPEKSAHDLSAESGAGWADLGRGWKGGVRA